MTHKEKTGQLPPRVYGRQDSYFNDKERFWTVGTVREIEDTHEWISRQEHDAIVKPLVEALEHISSFTKREKYSCAGKHRQYSIMDDSKNCPLCGNSEDGPGGILWRHVPTKEAQKAIAVLAAHGKAGG